MSKKTYEPVILWKETKPPKPRGTAEPLPADHDWITALEDAPINFDWQGKDVKAFIHMWEGGLSLQDIAASWPERNPDDVIYLWQHCSYMGWIQDRPGGIYGRRRKLKELEQMRITVMRDRNNSRFWRAVLIQPMFGKMYHAYLPERFKSRKEAEKFVDELSKEQGIRRAENEGRQPA